MTAFDCPAPSPTDENLNWTGKGKETYNGDQTIEYSCPKGFKLKGVNNNTCIDEDRWANLDPACTAFNCSAPRSTDKHLNWTDKSNETYNGDQTIEYSCAEGLELKGSKTNTCTDQNEWKNEDPTCNSGNVVQVFWYFFLMTTFYSIFSFYM
ncbi:Complement receptor type 2 [Holothuria leucospilota]|uniref:Complement receptor type 2 n=1 Tax=Holothuria leucospilota TaxID=206669 RepID=A0A9Q1BB54_HOLLE|nr:Complement receptor type 2 [Holothuria leucospilota]